MSLVLRSYDLLLDVCGWMATLSIALLTVGITADVLIRNVTGGSISWMLEVTEYVLYAGTMIGAPYVVRRGGHAAVDVLVEALPARPRRLFALVSCAICVATSAALAFFGWRVTMKALSSEALVFKSVVFPEWWVLVVLPISGLLLTVEFLRLGYRLASGTESGAIAHRQAPGA